MREEKGFMKVLFVGYRNPNFETITEYMEWAFEREGHKCIFFDDRKYIIPGRLREANLFFENIDLQRINYNLITLAKKVKPDVCLISGGHRIFPKTIENLKKLNVRTALWTIDPPTVFKPILKAAGHYDQIFCGGTEAIELFKDANIDGSVWLPFGFEERSHRPVVITDDEKQKYGSDVVFVGSHYPNREEVLSQLTDFNLGIWGPGWEKVSSSSPLKKQIKGYHLNPDEWLKIYAACKVVVVIHYQDEKTPCYQVSPKVYEALACEKMVLCDGQRDAGTLFKNGVHLDTFDNIDQLRLKIKLYLKDELLRREIGQEARREVLKKHTYNHRVRQFVRETKDFLK
jgi:spore maturation protein CgeB